MWLRQSTAVEIALGPFVDATDGFTAETALGLLRSDVRVKKYDNNWIQKSESSAPVHEENGWYRVILDATDTTTPGQLIVAVSKAGARPVSREFMIVSADAYDAATVTTEHPAVKPVEALDAKVQAGTTHVLEFVAVSDPPAYGKAGAFAFDELKMSVGDTVFDISNLDIPTMVEAAVLYPDGTSASTGVTGDPVFAENGGDDGEHIYDIPVTDSSGFGIGTYARARNKPAHEGRVYEVLAGPDGTTLRLHAQEEGFDIADGDTIEQVIPSGRYVGHLAIPVDAYLSIADPIGKVWLTATADSTDDGRPFFDETVVVSWSSTLELDLTSFNIGTG